MTDTLFYSFCFIWLIGYQYTLGRLMVDGAKWPSVPLALAIWPTMLGVLMEAEK